MAKDETLFETQKVISIKEFRKLGYLQEINRRVLHPLGLAQVIEIDNDSGEESLGDIIDNRSDPEGIIYDEIDAAKKKNIEKQLAKFSSYRQTKFGYVVQEK